jgi:hypothetical protein
MLKVGEFGGMSQPIAAVAMARGHFGNPKEEKRPLLEAVTRRLVKT